MIKMRYSTLERCQTMKFPAFHSNRTHFAKGFKPRNFNFWGHQRIIQCTAVAPSLPKFSEFEQIVFHCSVVLGFGLDESFPKPLKTFSFSWIIRVLDMKTQYSDQLYTMSGELMYFYPLWSSPPWWCCTQRGYGCTLYDIPIELLAALAALCIPTIFLQLWSSPPWGCCTQ